DVLSPIEQYLSALVPHALAPLSPERRRRCIDELYETLPSARFPVRNDPDVSGDPGVVEELLRQRDERFEQVVLQDEPTDFAFTASGMARDQRRAVHDDRDARAAVLRVFHVRQHVQQEEELTIADPRETRRKTASGPTRVLGAHRVLIALP